MTGLVLKHKATEQQCPALCSLPWSLIQVCTLTASELVFVCCACSVAEVISETKNHFPNLRRSPMERVRTGSVLSVVCFYLQADAENDWAVTFTQRTSPAPQPHRTKSSG